jgi:hypothetical protein
VSQDPSWPIMFQSQSFPRAWYQIPQLTIIPVTVSHIGAPSPTFASHVGDESTTSTSLVDNLHLTTASHVGGTTLIDTSHINFTYPTFVGYDSLTSTSHVDSMPPTLVNNTGGIEKPRCLRHKPKFLCRNCEGDHLTRLCLATVGIPEARGSPKGPSDSQASIFSPHLVP